jgi:hypothetical protein
VEPKTYTLKHPVDVGSQTITTLTFKRPIGAHVRRFPFQNPTAGDLLDIGAKMCEQPQVVMDKLDLEDILAITQLVADFLPDGLLTGLKP